MDENLNYRELEDLNIKLTKGVSEVIEALEGISSGEANVKFSEKSDIDLIKNLKKTVNKISQNLSENAGRSNEFAIGIAEHFEVVNRVSNGDMTARVSGTYETELLRSLKRITNEMIANVDKEIRDRKSAEEAIKLSEDRYRTLIENIQDGVFILQDDEFKFVNDAFARMIGYSVEEVIGMNSLAPVAPEDSEVVKDRYERRQRGEDVLKEYEFRLLHRDGKTRVFVNINSGLINYGGRPATMATVKDITERKLADEEKRSLEAQFQQAQRLESLGTLAGGIAHNFNNLLMGIQGNTSLLLLETEEKHSFNKKLKTIEKLVQSGAKLTSQLLGYAREGGYEIRPTDLNKLVKETSDAFAMAKKEIIVKQNISEDLSGIMADKGQIEQVLLNLFVNAADAMPGGGELIISARNISSEYMIDKPYKTKPGQYVMLIVEDTGEGMNEKTIERIFEPFFTTKGLVKGTGLGLSSAYGIVKAHGGYIDVTSEKGVGTVFNIYLPASFRSIIEETHAEGKSADGIETIMLVDDEELVLYISAELLEKMGFRVIKSKSGNEAVKIFGKQKNNVDMVILDMIMPDMGGGETFDRLREMDPNVRVLLSSGYSVDGRAKEILDRGCNGFIQKPFDMEELSSKIKDVLEMSRS